MINGDKHVNGREYVGASNLLTNNLRINGGGDRGFGGIVLGWPSMVAAPEKGGVQFGICIDGSEGASG